MSGNLFWKYWRTFDRKQGREAYLYAIKLAENWEKEKSKKLKEKIDNQEDFIYEYTKEFAEKLVRNEKLEETIIEEREKFLKTSKELAKEQLQKENLLLKILKEKSLAI